MTACQFIFLKYYWQHHSASFVFQSDLICNEFFSEVIESAIINYLKAALHTMKKHHISDRTLVVEKPVRTVHYNTSPPGWKECSWYLVIDAPFHFHGLYEWWFVEYM